MGLFLGALNVFVRDTALAIPNLLTMIMFASPIFYPLTAYPTWAQRILQFNPFYVIAECYRRPILDDACRPVDAGLPHGRRVGGFRGRPGVVSSA